jgi:hypothetical protein
MDSYMPLKQLPIAQYTPRENDECSPEDFLNCFVDAIDFFQVEQLKWESLQFASCQRRRRQEVSKSEHQENRRPSSLGRGDKTVIRLGISERGSGGYSWCKLTQKGVLLVH